MEIKNLKKTAGRIKKAVENREKIILYGDSDLDGIGSVIILEETIQNLGGSVGLIYFPDQKTEDHGINKKALSFLKNHAPALFIALDCGITNFKEVNLAEKLGFEVIIIDHHRTLDKLPKASIIVDPHQPQDRSCFKDFATVGIVFKLAELLLGTKLTLCLRNNFLELVALATLSDMMPEIEENQEFIEKGLISIENTWRPGLKVFFETGILEDCNSTRASAQRINSILNSGVVKNHLNEVYLLLSLSEVDKAKILAQKLFIKSFEKKIKVREIVEEINLRIIGKLEELIIFEGSNNWQLIGLGSAASKICNQYQKPSFIFRIGEEQSRGSVRTPQGFNVVEAMTNCSRFLKTFGGHALAAGFCFENKNLEKLKNCLIKKCIKKTQT